MDRPTLLLKMSKAMCTIYWRCHLNALDGKSKIIAGYFVGEDFTKWVLIVMGLWKLVAILVAIDRAMQNIQRRGLHG
jgi:hypothetical protein